MCQHLCFVLFLTSQRFPVFGHCAFNTDSCVCLSHPFFFLLPLHPVLHVAAPGSKGPTRREGESSLCPPLFRPSLFPLDSWGSFQRPPSQQLPPPSTQAPALCPHRLSWPSVQAPDSCLRAHLPCCMGLPTPRLPMASPSPFPEARGAQSLFGAAGSSPSPALLVPSDIEILFVLPQRDSQGHRAEPPQKPEAQETILEH